MLPTWPLSIIKSILAFMILNLLLSCIRTTVPTMPQEQVSCDRISNGHILSQCLERAKSGDPIAAFTIAELYDDKFFGFYGSFITKDRTTAFYWYKIAAGLGHEKSLRIVFDSYHLGTYGPKNEVEADRYLKQSAKLGHQWAMLLFAYRSEKGDPEKAMDLYLELARKDNCHAQGKLAKIYFEGILVPQDLCKSYFWGLLAEVGWPFRRSDSHILAGTSLMSDTCSSIPGYPDYKVKKDLGPKYTQIVQDVASQWKIGQAEPDFPSIQVIGKEKPSLIKIPSDPKDLPQPTEKPPKWTPAKMNINRRLSFNLKPSEVFNLVNPSVWTVISASTSANLKGMNNVSLASAVAVSESILLTNYHVIEGKPYVVVRQGDRLEKATIISADMETDRCVLYLENVTLKAIRGFTKYDNLVIGDTVYSVGSPRGLENTLGQGIISGKRELQGLKLIQTTAQISRGSSGGGLFDSFGNLVGITTFKLADSEGLNFALAIDNFIQ